MHIRCINIYTDTFLKMLYSNFKLDFVVLRNLLRTEEVNEKIAFKETPYGCPLPPHLPYIIYITYIR